MRVEIDAHEKGRIRRAKEYYQEQDDHVQIHELGVGDYVFDDEVVYEYKEMNDFLNSIRNGRVFRQAQEQAQEYKHHHVIIQGNYHRTSQKLQYYGHQTLLKSYWGAIARLNTYTTVIKVDTEEEAFNMMRIQAQKCLSNNNPNKKYEVKKTKNPAQNYLTNNIHGVSSKRARIITEELELKTLTDLLRLKKEDLLMINGVGENTADKIIDAIRSDE